MPRPPGRRHTGGRLAGPLWFWWDDRIRRDALRCAMRERVLCPTRALSGSRGAAPVRKLPQTLPRPGERITERLANTEKAPLCRAFPCAEEDSNLHPVDPDQALNLVVRPSYPSVARCGVRCVQRRGRSGRYGRIGGCQRCCHERVECGRRRPLCAGRRRGRAVARAACRSEGGGARVSSARHRERDVLAGRVVAGHDADQLVASGREVRAHHVAALAAGTGRRPSRAGSRGRACLQWS
jgi:hypothetical protein